MDPAASLGATALFRDMSRTDLEPLLPSLRTRSFRKSSYVFHEGDSGNGLFVINRGQVKISRMGRRGEEAVFAILAAGDTFGEIALLTEDGVRTADAQAMELTECLVIPRAAFLEFLGEQPRVMQRVIGLLARYIQQLDTNFAEIAFLDIAGRVAGKLLELSKTHGEQTPDGIRINMRLSQGTLAAMVAASRENVNRALQGFAARGAIKQEAGVITIVRPDELRKRS
jgi:CRP/FNR family transcriptional regulator, cyclic AMP receptor protein